MHWGLKLYKITRKDKSPFIQGRHQAVCKKLKRIWNFDTKIWICRQDTGIKCALLIIEIGKRQRTEGRELPNQERIRTLGGKETYKHFGILEADTIKQAEMKKKKKKEKNASEERERFSRPKSAAEISSKR